MISKDIITQNMENLLNVHTVAISILGILSGLVTLLSPIINKLYNYLFPSRTTCIISPIRNPQDVFIVNYITEYLKVIIFMLYSIWVTYLFMFFLPAESDITDLIIIIPFMLLVIIAQYTHFGWLPSSYIKIIRHKINLVCFIILVIYVSAQFEFLYQYFDIVLYEICTITIYANELIDTNNDFYKNYHIKFGKFITIFKCVCLSSLCFCIFFNQYIIYQNIIVIILIVLWTALFTAEYIFLDFFATSTAIPISIHLHDRVDVTNKRIRQYKNGKIKYTSSESQITNILDEKSVKFFYYQYSSKFKMRNSNYIVECNLNDGNKLQFNTYYYLNSEWIIFKVKCDDIIKATIIQSSKVKSIHKYKK